MMDTPRRFDLAEVVGLSLLALLALHGCTLLSDFDAHQCSSHADCAILEGDISHCAESRCVPGCVNNQNCASIDPNSPICPEAGAACVGLTTPDGDCYATTGYDENVASTVTAREMTILGAFAPTVRSATWLTSQLAVAEINAGELQRAQPVVMVLCQDSPATIDEVMEHLDRDLGVHAFLGSLEEVALSRAVERSSSKDHALFFSPNGVNSTSQFRTGAEQPTFYWGPDYAGVVPFYRALVARFTSRAKARGVDLASYRVATLVSEAAEDSELANAASRAIAVGDVGWEEMARLGRFRKFDLAAGLRLPDDLVAHQPNLVLIFAGGSDSASPYRERASLVESLAALEAQNSSFRPVYLLGPRNTRDPAPAALAATNAAFRSRALVVTADRAVNPAVVGPLSARFNAAFPMLSENLANPSIATYDVLYYLASAIAATPEGEPLTAETLVGGLLRVTDPTAARADVDPGGLGAIHELLQDQGRLNLYGTSGPADFDVDTRARPGVPRAECWGADGERVELASYDPLTEGLVERSGTCTGDWL